MELYKKVIVIFLFFFLVLCACLSLKESGKKIEFYNLEYNPPEKVDSLYAFPLVIRIERFSVAPDYNTKHIVYRDRAFIRNTLTYHQWRDNPGDLVTHFLYRDLKQSGLFKTVLAPESGEPFSHILEGSVDEFFQWDAEENLRAVLFISINLSEKNEKDAHKKPLFQGTYSTSKTFKQKGPGFFAEAMSAAMKEISGKIIEDLYHFLKDRY